MHKSHAGRRLAAAVALVWTLAGCARATLVLPIELRSVQPPAGTRLGAVGSYDTAVRSIASILVTDFLLPLPERFTVRVYPSQAEYERGLIRDGRLPPGRAAEVAGYSVALGQPGRLFINDGALRGAPRRVWLGVVAHELTHLAQYELSGGRRGRSEQWLREGMADWVAARVLERLGEETLLGRRQRVIAGLARGRPAMERPLDLVDLGRPLGWEARHLASDERPLYPVAFLLVDDLVRRRGFESLVAYFRAFAESGDRFGHFQRAFGFSLPEFEAAFLAGLRDEIDSPPPASTDEPGAAPGMTEAAPVTVNP